MVSFFRYLHRSHPDWTVPFPLRSRRGGALGNLFDRALDGVVTDFLLLFFGKISLFVFNPADLFITIGAILFIANEINVKKGSSNS